MPQKRKSTTLPPLETTVFDNTYRTILQKLRFLIIPAINEAFGTHYDERIDYEQLRNEQLVISGKIITDSIFRLGNKLYHIECQSTKDGTMVIRMFEYDVAIAVDEARKTGSPYSIDFPRSAVIFLRHDSATPDTLSLQVTFPDNQKITYQVPVIKMQEYSLDDIARKHLWLLVPYYLMRYESQFDAMEQNKDKLKAMLNNLNEMFAKLKAYAEDTEQWNVYTDLLNLTKRVANHLLQSHKNTRTEVVKIMVGKVYELPSERLIRKGKKAGRAEGRAEERKDGIKALIVSAKAFAATPAQAVEQLMKNYSLTKDEAQAAVQANW